MTPPVLFIQIIKYASQFGPYVAKVVAGVLRSFADSHPEIMSPGPQRIEDQDLAEIDERVEKAIGKKAEQ